MEEILKKPIEEIVFSSVDVETTGLKPSNARICEIACLQSRDGKVLENFSTLVNPGIPIPPEVSAIHKITDDMVAGKPKFRDIADKLLSMFEGTVLVAHNAPFDISFLKMEFERIGLRFPGMIVIDTLEISRKFGNFSNNKLGTVARNLNISTDGWHRALNDVIMAQKILEHFTLIFRKDGIFTLNDMVRKIKGY